MQQEYLDAHECIKDYVDEATSYPDTRSPTAEVWNSVCVIKEALSDWRIGRSKARRRYHEIQEALKITADTSNSKTVKPGYLTITVNPSPIVPLDRFLEQVASCITNAYVSQYAYTLEQRSDTLEDMGKGFHCHMIITSKYAPSNVRQKLEKTFAGSIINMQPRHKTFPENYQKYITGDKRHDPRAEEKMKKVPIDEIWRRENDIKIEPFFQRLTCVENLTTEPPEG